MPRGFVPGRAFSAPRFACGQDPTAAIERLPVTVLRIRTYVPFYVVAGAALVAALIVATWPHWGPSLVINSTRSEPRGFYRLVSHEPQEYRRGMSVVFPVPDAYRGLVYARGWLANGVPLLKTIVALAG